MDEVSHLYGTVNFAFRVACLHRTKSTAPRAHFAHKHERGCATIPTLRHIRAARFLTNLRKWWGIVRKGYYCDTNENNNNKWCNACGSVQTCMGMRAHCNAAEWHGSHGYSGVSVARDMCMRMRSCACVCGIVCTCLCCHGLRCGSSSRRPGHGRPDSPPFSVSPCRGLRRISWKVS